jgi:serine phosphatase RsbU (regulator of sigma subunit)/ligand-binding sensor domain-containing protein
MLSYSPQSILIATREKGLFIMNNKDSVSITPLNSGANERLIEDQVYGGVALGDNKYAYATLLNGVLIIDSKGYIIQRLNKKNGLQDDVVKCIGLDNQQDLWIALGKGISHAEISSPLSALTEAQGINGTIENIIKHKSNIYLATSSGLFISLDNHFLPIKGLPSTWSLLQFITKTDTLLLASTESGVFKINGTTPTLIQEGFAYTLYQSKKNPERTYIGMYDGLSSIRFDNRKWIDEGYINGIDKDIRNIVEDPKGNLWLGTAVDGLIKLNFNNNSNDTLITSWKEKYSIQYLDTTNGLPTMDNNIPYGYNHNIIFGTNEGIYEFDEKKAKFFQSSFLKKELSHTQVYRFASKDSSSIYMFTVRPDKTKETGIAYLQTEKFYKWYTSTFRIIKEREIYAIFPDEKNITWLGGPDGLLRYDARVRKNFSIPFYAHIRNIKSLNDTLFGGNFYVNQNGINTPITNQLNYLKPILNYINNSLTFEFSATSYSDEQNNKFSYYLEGHEKVWSDWSTKKDKEYSDLDEGDYIFHVKAKSIYGAESIESIYAFTILPPWYRTIWAYIGYVIVIIGFIYLIVRLSVRRLVKAKNLLEATVKERTAEVVEQKHLIEEKHKEITDSINYAERIQRSFLATKELLDENLKDYFVFFKPKDVVSGDFYWAASISTANDKKFILATADSTGHGVPGAIMSLLNITSLERATEQHHTPDEILNHTRKTIIERLKKDGSAEGGKDGMDCSLCVYDFSAKKLFVASANNPVWIVRTNSNLEKEVVEIKPDKMPVGKHDRQYVPFTQHEIDLQSGDVVYTLTDGYPDQFGGEKGKKFMSKNLRELLASNSHLPMMQQKEILNQTFHNWVGALEQIDDVTILGVRIQ